MTTLSAKARHSEAISSGVPRTDTQFRFRAYRLCAAALGVQLDGEGGTLVASSIPAKGFGTANRTRYTNTIVDQLLSDALQTMDDERRDELLGRAIRFAMNDPTDGEIVVSLTRKRRQIGRNTDHVIQA